MAWVVSRVAPRPPGSILREAVHILQLGAGFLPGQGSNAVCPLLVET